MSKATPTTKLFSHRRSATGHLKALGVPATEYDQHIKVVGDKFEVPVALAPPAKVEEPVSEVVKDEAPKGAKQRRAAKPVKPAAEAKTAAPKARAVPKRARDGKLPVSQRCLELFKAGKSNGEVWAVVSQEYGLGEDKAHYPAWYRSHFRRRGELPKAEPRKRAA